MTIEFFMKQCINIAKESGKDIPVGCLIVKDEQIISSAYNKREALNAVSSHAEILALESAAKKLNNWRLDGCDLYVTLEPCPMCAWAILNSRIQNVYFGAYDTKYGSFGSVLNLLELSSFKSNIFGGIMEDECRNLILEYFKNIRKWLQKKV